MSSGRRPKAPRVGPERAAGSTPPRAQRAEQALDTSPRRAAGKVEQGWSLTPAAQKLGGAGLRRASRPVDLCGVRHAPASGRSDPLRHRGTVHGVVDAACFAQHGVPVFPGERHSMGSPSSRESGSLAQRTHVRSEGQALPSSPAREANVT